jgi:hypothetical protein
VNEYILIELIYSQTTEPAPLAGAENHCAENPPLNIWRQPSTAKFVIDVSRQIIKIILASEMPVVNDSSFC